MIKIHDIFLARFVCVFAFAMHLQCISMEIESNCNLILCHMDRFPVEVVVTEKQPYQERTNTWCLAVPPRCSKYQIKFRTVNKTQILMKERVVFECCGNWRLQSFHNDDFSLFPFPYSPAIIKRILLHIQSYRFILMTSFILIHNFFFLSLSLCIPIYRWICKK